MKTQEQLPSPFGAVVSTYQYKEMMAGVEKVTVPVWGCSFYICAVTDLSTDQYVTVPVWGCSFYIFISILFEGLFGVVTVPVWGCSFYIGKNMLASRGKQCYRPRLGL